MSVPSEPTAASRCAVVTIGPSPFIAWLGLTWTRSQKGQTIHA